MFWNKLHSELCLDFKTGYRVDHTNSFSFPWHNFSWQISCIYHVSHVVQTVQWDWCFAFINYVLGYLTPVLLQRLLGITFNFHTVLTGAGSRLPFEGTLCIPFPFCRHPPFLSVCFLYFLDNFLKVWVLWDHHAMYWLHVAQIFIWSCFVMISIEIDKFVAKISWFATCHMVHNNTCSYTLTEWYSDWAPI